MWTRYGQRSTIYAHIYDSATWKRICRTHPQMLPLVEMTSEGPNWPNEASGQLTIKSGCTQIIQTVSLDFSKYLWRPTLPLGA